MKNEKGTILIVEDDFLIADMAEEILVENGFTVCGIAASVDEAVALAQQHKPDFAMIDHRLARGGLGTEVATQLLMIANIGILYATGNYASVAMLDADGDACIGKPYRAEDLVRAFEIVADLKSAGNTVRPFPPGFRLLKKANLNASRPSDG